MSTCHDRGPRVASTRKRQPRAGLPPRRSPRLELEGLEARITPSTMTWSGTVDNIWSRGANWVGGVAPQAGDDLVFPAGADRYTTANDFAIGTSFGSITIQSSGYDVIGNALQVSGAVAVSYASGSSTIELDLGLSASGMSINGGGSTTMTGAISGVGGITIDGGSTVQMQGINPNSYTGATTVSDGTLSLSRVGVPAIVGPVVVGGGAGAATLSLGMSDQIADTAPVEVDQGGQFDLAGYDEAIGSLGLTGGTVTTGSGLLTLLGDLTSYASDAQSTVSGRLGLPSGAHLFDVASPISDPTVRTVISADISGAGAITKTGAGGLRFSGGNTFDGAVDVQAGLLEAASSAALGTTTGDTTVEAGAALGLMGDISTAEPITISGTGVAGSGAIDNLSGSNSLLGVVTLAADASIGVDGGDLTVSGQIIDGASIFALTKAGPGTLSLTNANPFDGGATISAGVVSISNGGALGTGTVTVVDGGELDLSGDYSVSNAFAVDGSGFNSGGAIRSVSGIQTLFGNVALQADGTWLDVEGGTLILDGLITEASGGFGIRKKGPGELNISGTAQNTGQIQVDAGTLAVTGSLAGQVSLNGGDLQATGLIAGGVFQSGSSTGTVTPGHSGSPSNPLFHGYTVGAGITTSILIGGPNAGSDYGQVVTNFATDNIGGSSLDVQLVNGYVPSIGDTFTILDNQSTTATNGTFAGLEDGDIFQSGLASFRINYGVGTDANDVTLTVVGVTYAWSGGGGDDFWSTPANWAAGQVPTPGSDLAFPEGASRLSSINDLATGTSFHSIIFQAANYTLTGNAITLTDGIYGTFSGGQSTLGLPITLATDATVDVATGGTIVDDSSIDGTNFGIIKTGGGQFTLGGNTLANTYNGVTIVNGGTLALDKADGVAALGGDLIVGDNTGGQSVLYLNNNQLIDTAHLFVYEDASVDFNGHGDQFRDLTLEGASVNVNGGIVSVTTSLTVNNSAHDIMSTINGPGTLDLASNDVTFDISDDANLGVEALISASIQDGGVIKDGSGTVAFSGDNTYGGNTVVNAGVIQAQSDTALGDTIGNSTTIADGASVHFLGNNLEIYEPFQISGHGNGEGSLYTVAGEATLYGGVTLLTGSSGSPLIGAGPAATLTINGTIDDGSAIISLDISTDSTGRVVLGGSNLFDGDLTVQYGVLQVANDDALGNPGTTTTVSVNDSSTLEVAGGIITPVEKSIQLFGSAASGHDKVENVSGDNTIQGAISYSSDTAINVQVGTSLTLDGGLNGGAVLAKDSGGSLVLANSNTVGLAHVLAGTMTVNGTLGTGGSGVLVEDGATVSGTGTISLLSFASGATLHPGDPIGTLNSGDTALTGNAIFQEVIAGPTSGVQASQLSVTGTVSLNGSILSVDLQYLPTAGDTFVIINNDGSDPITGTFNGLAEGATFMVGNQPFQISYVGGVNGNDVTLTALARTDTWTGLGGDNLWTTAANWADNVAPSPGDNLVFDVGASQLANVNDFADGTSFGSITIAATGYSFTGSSITLNGGVTASYTTGMSTIGLPIALGADQTFQVAAGGLLDVTGLISGGHVLTKGDAGTLQLSAANTYSGGTLIDGGIVLASSSDALGTGLVTINTGTVLNLSGGITLGNNVQVNSIGTDIASLDGHNVLTGTIDGVSDVSIDVSSGSILELQNAITQSTSNRVLNKTGLGELMLGAAGSYTGGTDVRAGVLSVQNATATGTLGLIYVESGATLRIDSASYNAPSGGLYIGGQPVQGTLATGDNQAHTLNGAIHLIGNAEVVAAQDGSLTLTGNIDGTGSVSVPATNLGTVIFSGIAAYTGDAVVAGGTMQVDGTFQTSRTIFVQGGTLAGSGTVGAVVADGGRVSPGGYPGTLTTGALTLNSGATYDGVIDGPIPGTGYSVISTSGPVNLNDATLLFATNYTPSFGTTFKIIDNTGSVDVSGTFNGLPEGSIYSNGGQSFRVHYSGGDGNDVTLTSIITTTTTVTTDVTTPAYGQLVTFTATVTASQGTPGGTVTFKDNGVDLPNGTVTLDGLGVATYSIETLGVGDHSITSDYGGFMGYAESTGTLTPDPLVVSPAETMTQVSSLANSSTYGDTLVFTALVSAVPPGAGVPTGTVEFWDGNPSIDATFLGSATLNSLGIATFSTASLPVSVDPHEIWVGFLSDSPDFTDSSSSAPFLVTVSPATLTVTADDQSRTYGDINPTLTYTMTGFVNGEDLGTSGVTGSPDLFTAATPSSPVSGSPYAINISQGTLAANNYVFSFVDGNLAVTKATLTFTADDQSRAYGDINPTLTYQVSGFVNGEDLNTSGVTGSPDLATSATPSSPVAGSPYAITIGPGTLTASNYDFSFVDGNLAVTRATLTVTADDQSREYGDANPTLTYTITGFVNGEDLGTSGVTGSPDVSTSATPTSPVAGSPYAIGIGLGSLAAANYDFSFQGGTLDVTPAPLTITADDQSKVFGEAVPTLTASYSGFKNGETPADLDTLPVLYTEATATSPVSGSPYDITASGASSGNYNIQYVDGLLTVNQSGTTTALNAPSSALSGQPVTISVQVAPVSPGAGMPSGTVTFYDGGSMIGQQALVNGMASLSQVLSPGTHAMTAVYSGDGEFQASSSQASSVQVNPASTVVTAQASSGSVTVGQPLTVHDVVSVVSPGTGTPIGTVVLMDGASPVAVASIDPNGEADLVTSFNATGNHSLTVVYQGSSDYASSTSAAMTIQVTSVGTTTTLVAPSSAVLGEPINLVASVSSTSAQAGLPGGTVQFLDGNTVIGTASLSNGVAVLTATLGNVGNHTLTAHYTGNAGFSGSTSSASTVTVAAATASVSLTVTPNAAVTGQTISLVAAVGAVAPSSSTPTGMIVFYDNGAVVGQAVISNGQASLVLPAGDVGSGHTYTAIYQGDSNFGAQWSNPASVTVSPATTTTVLTIVPTGPFRRNVQLTARVGANAPGGGLPNGQVVFSVNGRNFRTRSLMNGMASLTIPTRTAYGRNFRAAYTGSASYQASRSNTVRVAPNTLPILGRAVLHPARFARLAVRHG